MLRPGRISEVHSPAGLVPGSEQARTTPILGNLVAESRRTNDRPAELYQPNKKVQTLGLPRCQSKSTRPERPDPQSRCLTSVPTDSGQSYLPAGDLLASQLSRERM